MHASAKKVSITHEVDIALARIAGGEMADQLGFSIIEKHSLITSISELASNIIVHAGSGEICLSVVSDENGETGIEVIAIDQGPGITNIELAMQDGSSTHGGLGGGLPGVNRLMSETTVSSVVGQGTTVRAVKWANQVSAYHPRTPLYNKRNGPSSQS